MSFRGTNAHLSARTAVRIALVGVVVLATRPEVLHSQSGDEWRAPGWVGDATFLSLNALTSGLSAATLQWICGGSFADGFTRGAAGGAVHYAGMRLSARKFDGAGILGRQVSATGISIVRNASDGRASLDRLLFPVGPVHLHVERSEGFVVRPKVNVAAFVALAIAARQPELRLDLSQSLSAGAPVFFAPGRKVVSDGKERNGYELAGSIILSDLQSPDLRSRVLAHERIHVLQGDWRFNVWNDPPESWALGHLPGGSTIYRFVDIDATVSWIPQGLYELFDVPQRHRLPEIEAEFLENR